MFSSSQPFSKILPFRLSKSLDIGYITIIYFVFAYIIGHYLDVLFVALFGQDYNKRRNGVLMLEVMLQIIFVGIISYLVRNIVYYIPSPFNGFAGLVHFQVKELTDVSFFPIFIMMFQYDLQDKLLVIRDNLKNSNTFFGMFGRRNIAKKNI